MFAKPDLNKKGNFLDQAKAARRERHEEKRRDEMCTKIQAYYRGYSTRKTLKCAVRKELASLLKFPDNYDGDYKPELHSAAQVFQLLQRYLVLHKTNANEQCFDFICKYLLMSMESEDLKKSYVSLALSKDHMLLWIHQIKTILLKCCSYLDQLKPESASDLRSITVYLHMLLTFTSTATWKVFKGKIGEALKSGLNQLCSNLMGELHKKGMYSVFKNLLMRGLARKQVTLKRATLSAIMTISLRPLVAANYSQHLMTVFTLQVLAIPALIHHLSNLASEVLSSLVNSGLFAKLLDFLCESQNMRIVCSTLESNYTLCLLANIVQLGSQEGDNLIPLKEKFTFVLTTLLENCDKCLKNKENKATHWHPVLGWLSQKSDQSLYDAMPSVMTQLQLLWCNNLISYMFSDLLTYTQAQKTTNEKAANEPRKKGFWKKITSKSSSSKLPMDSTIVVNTCAACQLYQTALMTMSQLKMDILAGLSYNAVLLPCLWVLVNDLGPNFGLKTFLETISSNPLHELHPIFQLLILFCETASHLLIILDDIELYDQQQPLNLQQLVTTSCFINHFLFKAVWNGLINPATAEKEVLFTSLHNLLMVLYERDCRRSYCPEGHWLITDTKPVVFLQELEKGRKSAKLLLQKMPHIIPHRDRVVLFRKNVTTEREALGLVDNPSLLSNPPATLVTIHRPRLLEDGYRQLGMLPAKALKGLIRVKFINEQGLDEAGIDQDGVFKEFLEETIDKVFDPSLNLFKMTGENQLYPSPLSHLQENHLQLFEFVGRMLGKAVYEGIVVDVPFAPFFLTQMLGNRQGAHYSYMDELPSLDPELYKSLTYVKHYEGDIRDLELTFAWDEDIFGKVVTHELIPGGKAVQVTDENKISYVHHMAIFKMYKQIKAQTTSFIRGFKSIVNSDWLATFSGPELQKLISGDNVDVDIEDLKKHTQYYGGFYSGHKVIQWLWEVLQKDFSKEERRLFLKFVTSCSKPPLLGFTHMEPPFSIRCVEVSEEQDTGDTVGSVLKGFFRLSKKEPVGRLPTSSTCFNLLKLPNYQKRSTLRDKLRYAISSNTGFELS